MTKLVYGISILLVSAGMAVAQSASSSQTGSSTSSQPSTSPQSSSTTDQTQPPSTSPSSSQSNPPSGSSTSGQGTAPSQSSTGSSSGETTIQGCVGGSGDNVTLTDSKGKTWQLQSNNNAAFKEHVGHTVAVTGTPGSDGTFKVTGASMVSSTCSNDSGSAPSPKR